jgi:hypothetical protein
MLLAAKFFTVPFCKSMQAHDQQEQQQQQQPEEGEGVDECA